MKPDKHYDSAGNDILGIVQLIKIWSKPFGCIKRYICRMNVKLIFLASSLFISTLSAFGQQKAKIVKFDGFENKIESANKALLVVNFWATWCAPCIKELPSFESAFADNKNSMDLVLVNLDFADKIDKVNSFIQKKDLKGDVILLDEIDYNTWIDRVDPSWSGAIPATLFIDKRTGTRKFVEGELSSEELEKILNEFLN